MGILKSFTILAIAITWNVEPVNAQVENPCPPMKSNNYYVEADVLVYESPSIKSSILGTIPESQSFFDFADLNGRFSDSICWYKLSDNNYLNKVGWVSFSIDLPEGFDEQASVQLGEKNNLFVYNLIIAFILLFTIFMIVWLGIKTSKFILNTTKNKAISPQKLVQQQSLPKLTNQSSIKDPKNNTAHTANKNNYKSSTELRSDKQKKAENTQLISFSNDQTNDNKVTESQIILFSENEKYPMSVNTINSILIVKNFNSKNYEYFENQLYFIPLKPTDDVIHGLVGNLGINNEAELKVVETSQASYLSFEAEGKLWLIPNLKLSRWQQLLTNSAFFDVIGDSPRPKLVKPAQLEIISGDRHRLIAKGLFN